RVACLTVGLDPGVGLMHVDFPSRDSLALDIMEAVRPDVDANILDLLSTHIFRAKDFHETREGGCRILAPLTHHLAGNAPAWGKRAGAVAELVAKMLLAGSATGVNRVPTPISEDNRSAGR